MIASGVDPVRGLDLPFDLDELADVVDAVERQGVSVEPVELAAFLDGRGRRVSEPVEDRRQLLAVGDGRLVLLARFRRLVDEGPLIRHLRSRRRAVIIRA